MHISRFLNPSLYSRYVEYVCIYSTIRCVFFTPIIVTWPAGNGSFLLSIYYLSTINHWNYLRLIPQDCCWCWSCHAAHCMICSIVPCFAGKVGCWCVETEVKTTDMCLSGRHVTNMLADMSATRHKKMSARVPLVLDRHVAC